MKTAHMALTGWGRTTLAECQARRPERMEDMAEAFSQPGALGLVAHGAGRSYGDCALNTGGDAVLTGRLDRLLAFDATTGVVEMEPGVDFRKLLKVFLPLGWLAPVTPGTGFATMGGAAAHDVHGKNHEHDGSFGQHVVAMDVLTADGVLHHCAPGDALFRATMGGMGLTGIITRIALRMKRVPGSGVRVHELPVADLAAFLAAMEAARDDPYSVGWIDGTARGARLGRGVLETALPAEADVASARGAIGTVPVDLPGFLLNPLSIAAFNEVYFRRVPKQGRARAVHYAKFLYPLDAIGQWNRIYGKRGFYQFQCVVPYADGEACLRQLLDVIAESRRASFLAVLKRMGAGTAGIMSFPMPGYTLALDFPAGSDVPALYARLVAITRNHGGRVYLAKDALLRDDDVRAMYSAYPEFQAALSRFDPGQVLQSDMSRRLALHAAPAGQGA